MKRILRVFSLAVTVGAASGWGEPVYQVDGLRIGQPSAEVRWLSKNSGQFKHNKTTVEVKDGQVTTIWGTRLLTPTNQEVRLGQSGPSALQVLGKPDGGTLFGCGKTCQQIHFYKSQGLDLTVTDGQVTAIRLYKGALPHLP